MGLGDILRFGSNGRKMQGQPFNYMPQMGGFFNPEQGGMGMPHNPSFGGNTSFMPNDPVSTFNTPGGKVGSGLGSTLRNIGGWASKHPGDILNGVGLMLAYQGQRKQDKLADHEMQQRDEDRERDREERERRAAAIAALMPQIYQGMR